ncbi:MAG: PadR family transcriptional regulator, partial [Abitibacteriaceae bacterium]|nr:PadR family transcriptional regulator [Abditibacteriaceae bacterium]
ELVLLAILRVGDNAYGVTLREAIEQIAGRKTSLGTIYTTLDRLESKGFIDSRQGEKTEERGGRAKTFFTVNGCGQEALSEAERARRRLIPAESLSWSSVGHGL